MKYFSAILLIFAAILGIVSCILPYWSIGTKKQMSGRIYNMNVGSNMNAGLWGYCYDNVGSTKIGNAACHSFDANTWPTNVHSTGLVASRYLSIISIVLISLTALMAFFTQNKIAYITLCSLISALIISLIVVYYVVQQPLLGSIRNNYQCVGAEDCSGCTTGPNGDPSCSDSNKYKAGCTRTTTKCQVCRNIQVLKTNKEKQASKKTGMYKNYDIQNPPSCDNWKSTLNQYNFDDPTKIKTGDDFCQALLASNAKDTVSTYCKNKICTCPKGENCDGEDPTSNGRGLCIKTGNCLTAEKDKDDNPVTGTSGLYNRISEQAPSSDCTPGIGFCMYLEITSIVLVIGSIFALPGLFSKKSSKSK